MTPNSRTLRFTVRPLATADKSSEQHSGPSWSFRKASLCAIVLCLVLTAHSELRAQNVGNPADSQDYSQVQSYSPNEQQAAAVQPLNSDEVEQLVAPIALYPDPLVAQILAAATYPQQVTEADQWRLTRIGAPPEQIAAEADAQPWDPSVKALTAFPQVLTQMDRNLQWTSDLGNAYYNQPQDVLEAVQVMRRRAQAAGNLQSTPQEIVRDNPGYIEVAPANPQVVYVPAYNPWTIYGEPIAPYPGFSLLGVLGDVLSATPLRFGAGIAMAAFSGTPWGWLAWGLDWLGHALLFDHADYYSHSQTVTDWGFGHRGFYAYGGRGAFGREFDNRGRRGEEWGRGRVAGNSWNSFGRGGIENRGGWHSFARSNTVAGNSQGWNRFSRGETTSRNWRTGLDGLRGFRSMRSEMESRDRGLTNSFRENRGTYAANFHSAPSANLRESRLGNWPSQRSSSLHLRAYGESRGSEASHGQHGFGGFRSQRAFEGRSRGGFGSHGGGHAPKAFAGGGHFGGGHSHGGGHSRGGGHSHGSGHGGHRR